MTTLTFHDENQQHEYRIDGVPVPGVTGIIGAAVGHIITASEWHMERGRIHHACYAMIAKQIEFTHDEYSTPWVQGCRQFFAQVNPEVIAAEKLVFSAVNRYAGTLDLLVRLNRKLTILDFKNTATGTDAMQCAAYAIAHEENATGKEKVKQVATVEINGDGTYHMGQITGGAELMKARREFLACRAVYEIKQREGLLK
jgi:hypothetical protein